MRSTKDAVAISILGSLVALATVVACSSSGPSGSTDDSVRGRADDAAAAGSTGRVASPIINGEVDTTHQAVVSILSSSDAGTDLCTGTIVKVDAATSIGWVLTAAHCVATAPTVVFQGNDFTVLDVLRFLPLDDVADPRYQQSGEAGQRNDVAVIRILGVDAQTPTIPIATASDGLAVGSTITAVGYGRTTLIDGGAADTNSVRRKTTLVVEQADDTLIAYDLRNSGICQGDSGGPDLLETDGVEHVVGVHSFVAGDCDGTGVSGRVSGNLAFIQQALDEPAPTRTCAICRRIVNSGNQECARITNTCLADAACEPFFECNGATTSAAGQAACLSQFPNAEGPVLAAASCPCNRSCADVCGSTAACAGVPKCGFALPAGDTGQCATCAESACCQQVLDCSAASNCYQCLKNDDSTSAACANDSLRVALANCLSSSCANDCASTGLETPGATAAGNTDGASASSSCASSPGGGTSMSGSPTRGGAFGLVFLVTLAATFGLRRRRARGTDDARA